jgi:hypothetical protein
VEVPPQPVSVEEKPIEKTVEVATASQNTGGEAIASQEQPESVTLWDSLVVKKGKSDHDKPKKKHHSSSNEGGKSGSNADEG